MTNNENMKVEDMKKIIKNYEYIFIGEIHGTKEIPEKVEQLLNKILDNEKIIFCLELPKQAEKYLQNYFNNIINNNELFSYEILADAIKDNRLNSHIIKLCKKLFEAGHIIKCLENCDNENPYERDKEMASTFLEIINNYKADKYIIYVGNIHIIDCPIKINDFNINPIKNFLPKYTINKILTIDFNKCDKENITFDKIKNTITYNLIITEINANKIGIKNYDTN